MFINICALPNMNKPRAYHGICRIGSSVYCCGGRKNSTQSLRSCEKFDGRSKKWCMLKCDLPMDLAYQSLIACDQTIYSFGG